jgi:small subunit ribosomal protein S20
LANSAQAAKRARQGEKRRKHNASRRSLMRTRIKQVVENVENGDKDAAKSAYGLAQLMLDRMAKNNMIHKNKAARHKSRLIAKIKAM